MAVDTTPRTEPSTEPARAGRTAFWSAAWLVAEREIRAQLQTKSFWIMLGMIVVGVFALGIVPGVVGGDGEPPTVATVGPQAEQVAAAADLGTRPVEHAAAAEALVRDGDVDAAVVPGPAASADGVRVIGLSEPPEEVVAALSESPEVELLEPEEVSETARMLVTLAFAMTFLLFSMSGVAIAQSVVTEKQTRIVEILAATVPVRSLLSGKIVAYSLLVFGEVAVLALLAPLSLRVGGQEQLLATIAPAVGWFVPFFVLGFMLLASLWAVAGALISRMEDLGSTSGVVVSLAMVPYFGVIFLNDNQSAMQILSYIPLSAPLAMPVRLFSGGAQLWEPFVSMGILAATLVAAVAVATRIYTGSLLQTGGRVKLSQAWSRAD